MAPAHKPPLAGCHVLVVEDEYFLADDLSRALADCGAIVDGPHATVDEALDAIGKSSRLDLAVIDLNLRGMPAFPVADALRVRGVPVALVTGFDERVIPDAYRDVPRFDKPVDPWKLVHALGKIIGG